MDLGWCVSWFLIFGFDSESSRSMTLKEEVEMSGFVEVSCGHGMCSL